MTRQPSLWREFGITAVFLLVLGAVPGAMMVLLLHDQEKIGELVPAANPLNLGVVVSLGAVMGGLYLWSSAGPRENSRFRVQDLNLITGFILVASIILYIGSVLGYLASIFFRPQVRGVPAGDVVGWCIELALTYVFCTFAMTLVNYVDESADNKAYRQELNEKEGREWRRGFVENVLSFPENYPQEFGSGVEAGEMVRVSARSRKDLMGEWRLSGRSVLSFLPVIFLLSVICVAAWGFPGSIGGGWVALMCGIHALAMWCTGYVIFINLIAMPFGLLRAARPATIALLGGHVSLDGRLCFHVGRLGDGQGQHGRSALGDVSWAEASRACRMAFRGRLPCGVHPWGAQGARACCPQACSQQLSLLAGRHRGDRPRRISRSPIAGEGPGKVPVACGSARSASSVPAPAGLGEAPGAGQLRCSPRPTRG
mgnify:CR=1 FL=1